MRIHDMYTELQYCTAFVIYLHCNAFTCIIIYGNPTSIPTLLITVSKSRSRCHRLGITDRIIMLPPHIMRKGALRDEEMAICLYVCCKHQSCILEIT